MKYALETDDLYEHRIHIAGPALLAALHSLMEAVRQKVKYSPDDAPLPTWEQVRELVIEHCNEAMTEAGEW